MLIPNSNIWETRIQTVDALLTASADGRNEVYYLATVCQVGLDPALISVSPNPEYPICDAVEQAGFFGVHYLSATQGSLINDCKKLDKRQPDKLAALQLSIEFTDNGTPLLMDCLQSIECRVDRAWDSGDHRTFIGEVVERRIRMTDQVNSSPHRFGGATPGVRRFAKKALCATGAYDLAMRVRLSRRPPVNIEEGTARHIGEQVLWTGESSAEDSADRTEADPQFAMTPRIVRRPPGICLVGCGWWGQVHARNLHGLGSRVRRYFASRSPERANAFAERFGGEAVFPGLSEALADSRVDAVILALPHHLHAPASTEAIMAGKHVLVEKPLAIDVADAERLVEMARKSGVLLAVAEQYRLSPLVRRAREMLADGILGQVSIVNAGAAAIFRPAQEWKQGQSTMGGGVLLDLGIHYVDVLRYLFGEPGSVRAAQPTQADTSLEWEDSAVVSLQFHDGPVATISVSWSAHRSPDIPNLEIVGEKGSLGLWFSRPYLLHSSPLPPTHWAQRLKGALPWRVSRKVGKVLPRALERRIPVATGDLIGSRAIIEDFVSAITEGHQPAVSGREGLRDLRIVMTAYEAMERGVVLPAE